MLNKKEYVAIVGTIVCFFILLHFKTTNKLIAEYVFNDAYYTTLGNVRSMSPVITNRHKKIYVFYHVCTQGKYAKQIMESQMNHLITSGLYDKMTTLYYGCNCSNCDIESRAFFDKYDKCIPLPHGLHPNIKSYENLTLNGMLDFAKRQTENESETTVCLYIHTKGTSSRSHVQHVWREFMMYWLVTYHHVCLELLDRGFLTVGTLYVYHKYMYGRIYSGNFFWAHASYLKTLPYIRTYTNRFLAETLLLKKYIHGRHAVISKEFAASGYIPFLNLTFGYYKDAIYPKTYSTEDDIEIGII